MFKRIFEKLWPKRPANFNDKTEEPPAKKQKDLCFNIEDDPDHCRTITANRVWLVSHIDLHHTPILDQLVQDGVLTQTQIEGIKQENTTNNLRVSALLDLLNRGTDDDWQKFKLCLSKHGQGHVVQEIEEGNTHDTKRLQCLLAASFLKIYNKIDMWSWYDRHMSVPLDEIYVELILVRMKYGIHSRTHRRLSSYTEVFSEVAPGQRGQLIYLVGEPGVGKSTISRKICVDWSNNILDEERNLTNVQKEVVLSFKYVISIILRDIKTKQTLAEVLQEQLMLETEDAEKLYERMKENQTSTLFILDGYDEYRETTSDEITRLAHREHFPYANVFITSRHSSETYFTDQKKLPEIEVSLLGFSTEGIDVYVQKTFSEQETSGEAHRLLQKIKQSDDLRHLSRYPAMLLLMCCLWEETKQLANTVSEFYQGFIKYFCCRYEKKLPVKHRSKFSNILRKYHKSLMELGEIATGGMMKDRLELTFHYDEVMKTISKKTWNLGFLKDEHSTSESLVSFLHKTIQEWFVAFYVVNCNKTKQNELLLNFCRSPQAFRESCMLIRFVAGLGGNDIKKQIEQIVHGDQENMAEMHTSLQLSYLSELPDIDLVLPVVMKLYITDKYPAHLYVKYLSMNGAKVTGLTLKSRDERHLRLLQHLNAPALTQLWLGGSSGSPCSVHKSYMTQELNRTLTKFPLHTLRLSSFNCSSKSGQRLINKMYGYSDGADDDDVVDDDTSPTLLAVMRAVQQMRTLEVFHLEWTPMTNVVVNSLTDCLPNTHLSTLTLSACYLTSDTFWAVLNKLHDHTKRINFGVQNNLLGDSIEEVIKETEKVAVLRTLNLSGNDISVRVKENIKQILALKCPWLELKI